MHARIDQLLSLRDGAPVDASIRSHVQQCAVCLAESARLAATRERLRALPAIEPPRELWDEIQTRATSPARRTFGVGIAVAACLIALVAVSIVSLREEQAPTPLATLESPPAENLESLIEQSRELEAMLAHLPERPLVQRVATVAAVDSIEQRIQWLDWQLANSAEAGLDQRQAQRLWTERIELMDSLVKLRYAETAPLMFARLEGL